MVEDCARGAAVDGKANAVLRAFLAKAFGAAERNVTLLHGASGRRKLVRIEAPIRRPDSDWVAALR